MSGKHSKRLDLLLLVEDEPDHARLIMKTLKEKVKLMNPIHWVKNGAEAIAYITQTGTYDEESAPRPSLVLLDIKLPLKDGFEVLKVIKSNEKYRAIPVIMLTTTSRTDDVQKALDLGANDYIVKPVRFPDFVEKVGALSHYWIFVSDSNRVRPEW